MRRARGSSVLSFERSDTSRTIVKGEFVSSKPKAHRVKEERKSFVRTGHWTCTHKLYISVTLSNTM